MVALMMVTVGSSVMYRYARALKAATEAEW